MASSSSSSFPYDVFPSFNGEVRKKFLSHLLNALQEKGIRTFLDTSFKSKPIFPELVRAIRESRIAIVILSERFASSRWCLNELLEIMECKAREHKVVTIFYDVAPSRVRSQTGVFGKAFRKTCVGQSKNLKLRWKKALTDVANIAGEHSKNWNNESAMVRYIASYISALLNPTRSRDFENFVGLEAHIAKMNSLLCLEDNEPRIIGIWGPAGIGKSTIARELYNRISSDFQLTLFMENVKGSYRRNGFDNYSSKLHLQTIFLSKILKDKDMSIDNLSVVVARLRNWKVLVVLDDVDHIEQLTALADQPQWFGRGSRIIVTTDHRDILKSHGTNYIYVVDFPSRLEALQIFSRSAFKQDFPPREYEELAVEVAQHTKLPLGLSVLGSSLRDESKSKWVSLKSNLHEDIERVLKVGYDSLGDDNGLKAIFLYIACMFHGERRDHVTQLLAGSNLGIDNGLDVLVDKALIYISSEGRIMMHHLLQQMGKQIVRRQSTQEPERRQFLVDATDIHHVLVENIGTGSILGISFNTSEIEELFLGQAAFIRMHNLQILRIYKNRFDMARLHLAEGLECLPLPRNLRLLHWEACPMKCINPTFSAKHLVEINMQNSKLKKLWQGKQNLSSLKKINLSGSIYLEGLADFSGAEKLERLELTRCQSLVTLPSSIGMLKNLNFLHLGECINLESLPANLTLESLSFFNICECSKLETIPVISSKIKHLTASVTLVKEVPMSVRQWGFLETLTMLCCEEVKEFPPLPNNISKLYLDYSGIKTIPDWIDNLRMLKILSMRYCKQLRSISPAICKLQRLHTLNLTGCISVEKFPVEIFQSFNFKHELLLRLDNVQTESLPAYIPDKVHTFPLILFMCENDFTSIPGSIKHLSHLHSLHLHDCKKLISLPELPISLSELHAENCESLERISPPSNSFHTPKLVLKVTNCMKLDQEACKLLIEEWASGYAVIPGDKVPEYFSYKAIGSSLTIKLEQRQCGSLRFKACIVLPAGDWPSEVVASCIEISCLLKGKHSTSFYGWPSIDLCHTLEGDHLFILNSYFTLDKDNIQGDELQFNFKCAPGNILHCGVKFLETCPPEYDEGAHPKLWVVPLKNDEREVEVLQI